MILFGKPGSGKGTLSQLVLEHYPDMNLVRWAPPSETQAHETDPRVSTSPQVSVGDVLRKEIAKKSAIGRHAESLVARGGARCITHIASIKLTDRTDSDFVPDEVMLEITLSALAPLAGSDWILDGFPRTLQQGIMLDEALTRENRPLNLIVNLGVQDDTILRRIAGAPPFLQHLLPLICYTCMLALKDLQTAGSMSRPGGSTTRPTTSRWSRARTT